VLVHLRELVRTLLLAEIEVPENLVPDADGNTEKRMHGRMVRREPVRLRVRREVSQPQRPGVDDEEAEDPVTLGQVTDCGVGLAVDADRDELGQAPVIADHADRGVTSADELTRRLNDPVQHDR
jgi:hypothetical protein